MKKALILLGIIFILALTLRFYRLGDIPVGFHRDEAFLGYNAYSIMMTGRDMNGNFLPLHLESFLYSPAGYSYLSIPFVKLFDLSPFSVRFASALFGSLTVVVSYFLVRRLFHPRGELAGANHLGDVETLALISAGLLAINPWHINLSRTATESTVVAFFIVLGTLLFLLWTKKENLYLLLASFFCFGLTLLVYQAPRAFLPLFIPLLILIFLKVKINNKKLLLALGIFLITIMFPLVLILSSKDLTLRIKTVSIFATEETQLVIDEQLREDGVSDISPLVSRTFHNKLIGYSSQFMHNYFSHFSFDFLFEDKGLPIRYKIPNSGLLYLFELPLLLFGLFVILRQKTREGIFLLGWLILAPIGSALTFDDVPNLQRTLLILPTLSIIEGMGLIAISNIKISKASFFASSKVKYPICLFAFLFLIFNFFYYLHQYYVHGSRFQPWHRHDGYKELVAKVNELLPGYKKAIITNRESAPTIFFLFYGKYSPYAFQEETKNSVLRDFDRVEFGKYEFSQEECPLREIKKQNDLTEEQSLTGEEGVLFVNYGTCNAIMENVTELAEVKRGDGSIVFKVLEFQK